MAAIKIIDKSSYLSNFDLSQQKSAWRGNKFCYASPYTTLTILRNKTANYTVSKNVPPLACYNLYVHGSIATIFGTNVAEKVGKQNVLYFSTSPN